jgi:hypothetical protein
VNPEPFPPGMPAPRRARHGCFIQLLAVLALGIVLVLGLNGVFMPWAFYMGGRSTSFPSGPAGDACIPSSPATTFSMCSSHRQDLPSSPATFRGSAAGPFSALRAVRDTSSAWAETLKRLPAPISRARRRIFICTTTAPYPAAPLRPLSSAASGTTLTWCLTTAARSLALLIPAASSPILICVLTYRR